MQQHFDDLSEYYFYLRIPSANRACEDKEDDQVLNRFGHCMTNTTRLVVLVPLYYKYLLQKYIFSALNTVVTFILILKQPILLWCW